MEIKKVENETNNDYPQMEEVSKKKLKKSIPKKWKVIGISSLALALIGGGSALWFANKKSYYDSSLGGEVTLMSFNSKFEQYIGRYVRGSNVNALLHTVLSNNKSVDTNDKKVSIGGNAGIKLDKNDTSLPEITAMKDQTYTVKCYSNKNGYINYITIDLNEN